MVKLFKLVRKSKTGKVVGRMRVAGVTRKRVKNVVQQVLKQQLEKKHYSWEITTGTTYTMDISGNNILPLVGSLAKGVGSTARIGNRIKPVSIFVKGTVCVDPTVGGLQSLRPVLYFLNHRAIKSTPGITANKVGIASQLLDDWEGNNVTFDGTLDRAQLPVNTDDMSVIRFLHPCITKDNTTSSDGKSYYEFVVKLKAPAHLIYDEGNDYANNFAPYLAVGYHWANGKDVDPEQPNYLSLTMKTFMIFTDA